MEALSLVGFEGWFLCEAPPAFGTGVFVDGDRRTSRSASWLSEGIAAGAGAVLGGFLVLDQRGHGSSGCDINLVVTVR
jgi:hypothetical protein